MANYTNVTASNICDAAGNKLASGTISFQATDAGNRPIVFQVGGGGQVVTTPATATITNGACSLQVADSASTNPSGILYRITITDTTLNRVVATLSLVTITGATFNLDAYTQSGAAVLPPVGGSVNGPLTVAGDLSVTGAISALSFGTLNAQRFEGVRFADQFSGADIGAKVNAAIADLGSNGGIVVIPAGNYSFSTQINASSKRSIILQGAGGLSSGSATGTTLTWTGTGTTSPINLQNSLGCSLRDLFLVYSSSSFTGVLVDASGPSSSTAYLTIQNCSFDGALVTTASVIISLDKAQSSIIQNCRIGGGAVGIRGSATNGSYSNAIQVLGCTFSNSGGTISSAMIQNPIQGWVVSGCTFELGAAAGNCKILDFTGTNQALGLIFTGNWAGDDNAASART